MNNRIRLKKYCLICFKNVATLHDEIKNEKTGNVKLLQESVHNFSFVDHNNSIVKIICNNNIRLDQTTKELIDQKTNKCALLCFECLQKPFSEC